MKHIVALALGLGLAGCAPAPVPPPPRPVALDPATISECALIQREIAAQQRQAALGGIDATPLVRAAVQLNAYNVIEGLRALATIIGCA